MFKAFKLLRLGNFQRRVWMAFKLAMEISTVKMVVRNFFYRIFHSTQNDHGNFQLHFVKMKKTMEISNVVVGKSPYFWLSEDSFLLSLRAKSSFLQTTYF